MPVSEMLKLRVISHKSIKDELVEALQRLGVVEFIDLPSTLGDKIQKLGLYIGAEGKAYSETESFLNDLRLAIEYLESINENKKGLMDALFAEKLYLSRKELENRVKKLNYREIVDDVRRRERRGVEIKNKKAQLYSEKELLKAWESLNVPLEFFEVGTLKTLGVIGSLKKEEFQSFSKDIKEKLSLWEIIFLPSPPEEKAFALIYLRSENDILQEILRNYNFNAFTVPKRKGTPREAIAEIEKELSELEEEERENINKLKAYLMYLDELKLVYDYLSIILIKQKADSNFLATSKVFMFEGWLKKSDEERIKKLLDGYRGMVAYSFEKPSPEDNVPVVIENHPIVRPFEVLTALYGLPIYGKDIDPTPFFAPFFFVFFGLCLTDAGYGLVIAILFSLILARYRDRISTGARKFFLLLLLGGISTIIFGGIEAAWFGDLFYKISWLNALGKLLSKAKLLDPMENPMLVLGISLALGIVHIFVGLILKAYVNIKQGNLKDAIFDQFGWLWFLSSLLLLGAFKVGKVPQSLGTLVYAMVGGSALLLIATQGREEKNIIKRVLKGIFSLYDVMGYLSDVLSYSRLLALGLGTAVIAMIVNMLAMMVINVPFVGIVIAIVILIIGHILSILVNSLGAFVHSTRLQYVEFFSKFYTGGGKAFEPFAINTKFTKIAD